MGFANGTLYVAEQNARQLLRNFSYGSGSTIHLSEDLSYDKNGNITTVTDLAGGPRSKTMSYDALDRLTSATAPGLWGSETYAYDPINNIRSRVTGTQTTTYNYDSQNRLGSLSGAGATSFGYDPRGNVTSKGGVTLSFDAKNQLLSLPGVSYAYDAAGRRVRKTIGGVETYYFYSQAGQLLHQWEPGSDKVTNLIALGRKPVARSVKVGTGAATVTYSYADAQGTPLAEANTGGTVTATFDYRPYGVQALGTAPDGVGYTGHVNDPDTGLVYMQARYYDSGMGRFLSVDPVTALDGDMRHFNRYNYAYNNPYKFTDPDGRCPWCVGAAIGAGLDFVIQIAEIGLGSRTEIDKTSILISAGTGALGVGLAGKVGRIGGILVDAAMSEGSTAAKGEGVTVGGVVADVAFGRAGGAAAEKAIVKTVEHKIAQRQVNRLERIGNKPGARNAQNARSQNAGPALQRNTEQKAAQAGVVAAGVGSAAEKQVERVIDEDKNR